MSPQYGNSGLELKCSHCFPKQFGQNLTGSVGIFPSLGKTINESYELFAELFALSVSLGIMKLDSNMLKKSFLSMKAFKSYPINYI